MTLLNAYRAFNLELDKSGDIASYPSFLPEEKDYWINTAITRITKTRYSGVNSHKLGFQQDQKRSDDLRTLVKTVNISTLAVSEFNGHTVYSTSYPNDYWFALGEYVNIKTTDESPVSKRTDVVETTIENLDSKLSDTLSDHIYHLGKAKPLRVYADNKIDLYTDGTYIVSNYSLTYLMKPKSISWYPGWYFLEDGSTPKLATPATTYCYEGEYYKNTYNNEFYKCNDNGYFLVGTGFTSLGTLEDINSNENSLKYYEDGVWKEIMPDHMWDEIIVLAVRLALENISDSRYQTYSQESQVIE
jgi:hypothetical protein